MIDSVGQIFLTEALILYRFVACDNVYCRVTMALIVFKVEIPYSSGMASVLIAL